MREGETYIPFRKAFWRAVWVLLGSECGCVSERECIETLDCWTSDKAILY